MTDTLEEIDLENLLTESLACEFKSPETGEQCPLEATWILSCPNPKCGYSQLLCDEHANRFRRAMNIALLARYEVVCEHCEYLFSPDLEVLRRI